MEISRRGLLGGLVALVAAPAIVRVENLMVLPAPAKLILPEVPEITLLGGDGLQLGDVITFSGGQSANNLWRISEITREAVRLFKNSNAFLRNMHNQCESAFAVERVRIGSSLRIRLPNGFILPPPRSSFSEWAREREAKVLLAGLPEGQRATNSSE